MLDQAVGIERVGDETAEFEVDAGRLAVGGHQGRVLAHLVVGVVVLAGLVPGIFVFAFLGGIGVELVGEVVDVERHGGGGGAGAEDAERWRGGIDGWGSSVR